MGTTSLILAMRPMFDAGRAGALELRLLLQLGHAQYRVTVAEGALELEPVDGAPRFDVAVEIETDSSTLNALLFGGPALEAARIGEAITITGDEELFQQFLKLFPLPETAPRNATAHHAR